MPSLSALTVRYALDQSNRAALTPYSGVAAGNIYLGNPLNVQACLFSGTPSADTFIDDLSNLESASLVFRVFDAKGATLIQKDLDDSDAGFDITATYAGFVAGTEQHFNFSLNVLDTNISVPSCGQLDYYAGIAVNTTTGPILAGFFKGLFVDDGVAVWVVGVTAVGAPILFYRFVDSYVGSSTSLEAIHGDLLVDGSIVKVTINGSDSEWIVSKPSAHVTNVPRGYVHLLDGSASLARDEGL